MVGSLMKKIFLIISINCLFCGLNFASNYSNEEDLPKPDSGVRIITTKKSLDSSKNEVLTIQKQIKMKGYYQTYSQKAATLIGMKNVRPLKKGSNNYHSTELKSNIEDLGLAFPFKGVPVDPKNVIGYAAALSYEKDKGWTGVTEVFIDEDLGTCQYTLFNWKLSHGSANIPEEVVSYDVNGKITTLDVRGNDKSGYIQTLHWANNLAMNYLLCANTKFKKANNVKLIKLAREIDSFVEPTIK